jgi:hypothetical protein
MLTTTSFQRPGIQLPLQPVGHQPDCLAVDYTLAGLYGLVQCDCLLDANAPYAYYTTRLTPAEADAWYSHFHTYVERPPQDEELEESAESEGELWQAAQPTLTDEAVQKLARATAAGLFDWIEIWYTEYGEKEVTLVIGFVCLTLNCGPEEYVAYPIDVVSEGPISIESLYVPAPSEDETPATGAPVEPFTYAPVDSSAQAAVQHRQSHSVRNTLLAALTVALVLVGAIVCYMYYRP